MRGERGKDTHTYIEREINKEKERKERKKERKRWGNGRSRWTVAMRWLLSAMTMVAEVERV